MNRSDTIIYSSPIALHWVMDCCQKAPWEESTSNIALSIAVRFWCADLCNALPQQAQLSHGANFVKRSRAYPPSTDTTFWLYWLTKCSPSDPPRPVQIKGEHQTSAGMYTDWIRKYHSLTQSVSTSKGLSHGTCDKLRKNSDDENNDNNNAKHLPLDWAKSWSSHGVESHVRSVGGSKQL